MKCERLATPGEVIVTHEGSDHEILRKAAHATLLRVAITREASLLPDVARTLLDYLSVSDLPHPKVRMDIVEARMLAYGMEEGVFQLPEDEQRLAWDTLRALRVGLGFES